MFESSQYCNSKYRSWSHHYVLVCMVCLYVFLVFHIQKTCIALYSQILLVITTLALLEWSHVSQVPHVISAPHVAQSTHGSNAMGCHGHPALESLRQGSAAGTSWSNCDKVPRYKSFPFGMNPWPHFTSRSFRASKTDGTRNCITLSAELSHCVAVLRLRSCETGLVHRAVTPWSHGVLLRDGPCSKQRIPGMYIKKHQTDLTWSPVTSHEKRRDSHVTATKRIIWLGSKFRTLPWASRKLWLLTVIRFWEFWVGINIYQSSQKSQNNIK